MNLLEIKRDLNKSALALLLYVLSVQILAVLLVLLLPLTKIPLLSDQYICMVISVIISYCLLDNIFPKETVTEPSPEKPSFSVLSFLHYFMLFQAAQWIGGIINIPIITLFTKLGLNLSFSEEAARGGSLTNAPMLFYTILVAPLMEELVFRGIFYRRFRS